MMKRKSIKKAAFLFSAFLAAVFLSAAFGGAFPFGARAAVLRSDPMQSVFAGMPEAWEVNGDAEYSDGVTGLLFNMPNEYQPQITHTKNPIPAGDGTEQYAFEIAFDFDVRDRGLGGRIGLGLGLLAATGHLYNCGVLFDVGVNGDLYARKNNKPRTQAALTVDAAYNSYGSIQGKNLTMKAVGAQNPDGSYDVNLYLKAQGADDSTYFRFQRNADSEGPTAAGVFCDGYMSLVSIGNGVGRAEDGLLAVVKAFDFICTKGAETEPAVAFSTDFTGADDRISYPSARNDAYDWRLSAAGSYAPESAYYMGKCGEIQFPASGETPDGDAGAGAGKLVSAEPLFIDTRSDKITDLKFTVRISELKDGGYFGLGLGLSGKAAKLDESNMFYLKKAGAAYYTGKLVNGVEYDNTQVTALPLGNYTNGINTVNLQYKIYYDTANKYYCVDEYVVLGSPTAANATVPVKAFSGVGITGYYGMGTAGAGASAEIYAVSTYPYDYFVSRAADEAIDFLGVRTQTVDQDTYDTSYYKASRWFIAGDADGVFPPRSMNDGSMHQYLEFNIPPPAPEEKPRTSGPLTAFGPKGMYGDYIFRYTLTAASAPANSSIGLSFGRQDIEAATYVYGTAAPVTPMITFAPQGGQMAVSWNSLLKARDSSLLLSGGTVPGFIDGQVNFFAGGAAAYDVMLIAQNGVATLYYCDAANPDYTPRAVFDNAVTSGFIALTGDSRLGYSYKVTKLSVNKCDCYDRVVGDTRTAANLSDRWLNDIAQVDFSTDYINDTRFTVGKGIGVQNGALRFSNTARESKFETVGKFDNFQLTFDLLQKFRNTDVVLTFGKTVQNPYGYSIRFLAGTGQIELEGLTDAAGDILVTLPFNIYDYDGAVNLKLTCINNEARLYMKRADEPSAQLNIPVAVLNYMPVYSQSAGAVSVGTSAKGNMAIDNFKVMSLNFNIDIVTENYGGSNTPTLTNLDAQDDRPPVRPAGKTWIYAGAGIAAAAIAALAAVMIVKKKKATNKEGVKELKS
ncbi:MAG: hypothetical protein LBL66_00935 [Clostridiales bacterium]|jgi:hypothetical protein|nr:hypothetical protein [Clostridiales bacterium]